MDNSYLGKNIGDDSLLVRATERVCDGFMWTYNWSLENKKKAILVVLTLGIIVYGVYHVIK